MVHRSGEHISDLGVHILHTQWEIRKDNRATVLNFVCTNVINVKWSLGITNVIRQFWVAGSNQWLLLFPLSKDLPLNTWFIKHACSARDCFHAIQESVQWTIVHCTLSCIKTNNIR